MFRSAQKASSKFSFGNILSSLIPPAKKSKSLKDNRGAPKRIPRSSTDTWFTTTPDLFKFKHGFAGYVHHGGSSAPIITSLMDITDTTSRLELLPRRRLYSNPFETLSIKNGDDAMIISPNLIGVADGVSGWSGEHANSGLFARSFLEGISRNFTELSYKHSNDLTELSQVEISKALDESFNESIKLMNSQDMKGSSTLIIGMIIDQKLKILNIGDSKIMIIRNGEIVFANKEQYISTLCPEQVGTKKDNKVPSAVVQYFDFDLQADDLVLLSSDGLTDNLFQDEVLDIVQQGLEKNDSLQKISTTLLYHAKTVAFDNFCVTPYAEKINELNRHELITGGKLDDISICMSKVVLNI